MSENKGERGTVENRVKWGKGGEMGRELTFTLTRTPMPTLTLTLTLTLTFTLTLMRMLMLMLEPTLHFFSLSFFAVGTHTAVG